MLATLSPEYVFQELCGDRRKDRREILQGATFATSTGGHNYSDAPAVEYTSHGARLLLNQSLASSAHLSIKIRLENLNIQGTARVAWSSPVANGRAVTGVQFLELEKVERI